MAQSPWRILEDIPISGREASRLASRCARDLNRHLRQIQVRNGLLLQMTTLSQSILDLSIKKETVVEPVNNNSLISSIALTKERGGIKRTENEKRRSPENQQGLYQTSLITYENQTFSRIRAIGNAQLHPCFLNDVDRGVRVFLSNFLLKYVPEFEGIWVAFHPNIIAKEPVGFVSEAEQLAIVSFQIEVQCLVFRPKPGSVLAGIVQQVRPTHIAVMVHGLFNACVRKTGLDKRFEFREGTYFSRNGIAANIRPGSLVAFKVCRYHHSQFGEIMTIEGSVLDRERCGVLNPDTLELLTLIDQEAMPSPLIKIETLEQNIMSTDTTGSLRSSRSRSPSKARVKEEE